MLLGDVPTEQVESAVREALQRLKAGERGLAVHPNCGTNLATTGLLATSLAFRRFRRPRLAQRLAALPGHDAADDGGDPCSRRRWA